MRRLDISPCTAEGPNGPEDISRTVLLGMLFHAECRLSGRDVITADEIATRIEECKDDNILLEESEWQMLENGAKAAGWARGATPILKRVFDCPKENIENLESRRKKK